MTYLAVYAFASTVAAVVSYLRWRDAEGALRRRLWEDMQ